MYLYTQNKNGLKRLVRAVSVYGPLSALLSPFLERLSHFLEVCQLAIRDLTT